MSIEIYALEVTDALQTVNSASLTTCIREIEKTIKGGKKIMVAGNGGSAAIASHFVTDLSRCTLGGSSIVKSLSLNDNLAVVTATANDFGYEAIFEYQINRLGEEGDLLIVISSSGNSQNIINAIQSAKTKEMKSVSLTGFDGGKAAAISDIAVIAKTEKGNYGPTEDAHAILCHYIARTLK